VTRLPCKRSMTCADTINIWVPRQESSHSHAETESSRICSNDMLSRSSKTRTAEISASHMQKVVKKIACPENDSSPPGLRIVSRVSECN
jgi:hypothetical protein